MDFEPETSDGFWAPMEPQPSGMKPSSSEQEFQKFLEEAFADENNTTNCSLLETNQRNNINAPNDDDDGEEINSYCQNTAVGVLPPPPPPPPPPSNIPMDSEEYQEYLKSRLQFECATVAFFRSQNSEDPTPSNTTLLNSHQGAGAGPSNVQQEAEHSVLNFGLWSDVASAGAGPSNVQQETEHSVLDFGPRFDVAGAGAGPSNVQQEAEHPVLDFGLWSDVAGPSNAQQEAEASAVLVVPSMSSWTTSESSSSFNDSEDESETTLNIDSSNVEQAKRKLLNIEEARRLRQKRDEHKAKIEAEVTQLRGLHSNLVKQLKETIQMNDQGTVRKLMLKDQVENLRLRDKMLEGIIERANRPPQRPPPGPWH